MTINKITRTLDDVKEAVKRQFGDESGVQITDNDIIRWVNDAQDVIVSKNKVLKAKSTSTSVAGQASYTFPNDNIHQVESIHFKGYRVPNMTFPEAEEHIFAADPLNVALGDPVLWYEWGGIFTFWPTPNSASNIDLYFTKRPTVMGFNGGLLSLPDKYFPDIVRYVMQQAYEMDEDFQNSSAKMQQFEAGLNEKYDEERTAQNMTYETITTYDM